MDKCRGNQDTGSKVLADEEGPFWHLEPLDLLGSDRKASTEDGGGQNQN